MKFLNLLISLMLIVTPVMAAAPLGLRGTADTTTQWPPVIKVPNHQATKIVGGSRVETNNKNILKDPSLEGANNGSPWTAFGGSLTIDNTPMDGVFNGLVTATAQSLSFYQDSTLYASQFADGSFQGVASMWVRTSVTSTPIYVCPRQAGAMLSLLFCKEVIADGKWRLYDPPFTLGGTSNGIELTSNAVSITGDVEWDDAFVGVQNVVSQTPAINSQSSYLTNASTFTNATITGTPTTIGSGTYTYSSGVFTFIERSSVTASVSGVFVSGTAAYVFVRKNGVIVGQNASTAGGRPSSASYEGIFEKGDTLYFSTQDGVNDIRASILATTAITGSTYSSRNADTDWAACNFSTLAWQGLGTVTSNLMCKRQGSDLIMSGRVNIGTVSASEARFPLPTWNGTQLIMNSSKLSQSGAYHVIGRMARNQSGIGNDYSLVVPTVTNQTYMNIGTYNQTSFAPHLAYAANSLLFSADVLFLENIRIPINGWENSNVIIANLSGLESCTDSYECEDEYTAKISASCVVSDETPADWISGNGTLSSTSNCAFTLVSGAFTSVPNYTATSNSTIGEVDRIISVHNITTSAFQTRARNGVNADTATPIVVKASKTGADYIGKTAKAVASDQNLATPGSVKSTLCSAKISSTGVISDQKGGCFASCTNATTPVCTFTTNYWVAGQVPNCWHASDLWIVGPKTTTTTTFQGLSWSTSAVASSGAREYYCHGERQ